MKLKKILAKIISVTLFASLYIGSVSIPKVYAESGIWNYGYNGNVQTFTAPYTGTYQIEAWGASGGNSTRYTTQYGGKGGYTSGTVNLTANQSIYVYVGGQGGDTNSIDSTSDIGGYNGGGNLLTGQNLYGAPGGGATDFRFKSGVWNDLTSLQSRILVAGGGGGADSRDGDTSTGAPYIYTGYGHGAGGAGGGLVGGNGTTGNQDSAGLAYGYGYGTGGTQTGGGSAQWFVNGTQSISPWGVTGSFGMGGSNNQVGGGGGWYGGGSSGHGGAGGGSSYIGGVQNGSITSGVNAGNGSAKITNVTPTINVSPNASTNSVDMNWAIADTSQKYSYMLYSKPSTDSTFQTIPAKSKVKVLNIYPNVGNNLKTWMETNGYGKDSNGNQLITVDEINIDTFNNNPNGCLKDSTGNWKYDVVYIGAWDSNNGKNLNDTAINYMEMFIQSGRGILAGHDTIGLNWGASYGLNKLRRYFNIKVGNWTYDFSNVDFPYGTGYISDTITIKKKGLLTNYPWSIGEIGSTLTVPVTHSCANYAYGDIWMTFPENSVWHESIPYEPSGIRPSPPDDLKVPNNFYLTTWNNTAMIQTGHSGGQATPDEQKLTANTLFYLAQVTTNTAWSDHKGQDLASPNSTNITGVLKNTTNNQFIINYNGATDNGSTYDYYMEATGETNNIKVKSDTKTTTITTGVKGYAISMDKNPTGTPDKNNLVTNTSYAFNNPYSDENFYVHIASVDGAGNMSAVTNYLIDNSAPILNIAENTTALTEGNITLIATASDSNSGVKYIKAPDGSIINGSTANYVVNKNGKYTFETCDLMGNVRTQTINVTNIVYKPTLTATANNANNCVDLNWDITDDWQKYSYMLYSKNSNDTTFQTIPSKSSVKVLNVYPNPPYYNGTFADISFTNWKGESFTLPKSASLKMWMEQPNSYDPKGFGKGLIAVDEIDLKAFNNNPYTYLKNSDGSWKYDVVMTGTWDANNLTDLSSQSESAIEELIKSGRGYLTGHDTVYNYPSSNVSYYKPIFNKLEDLLNMNTYYAVATQDNSTNVKYVGSSSIQVKRKGLLTNYPWSIGDIGTKLNIPLTHSTGQFPRGDIWMDFTDYEGHPEVYGGILQGPAMADPVTGSSTNNFYLETWNNTAMIQTGHSSCEATTDEQKLLANTLFYLAQVTSEKTWSDHKGQDVANPNPTSITGTSVDNNNSQFTINYNEATDNGSTYNYYVEATGETNNAKTKSDTQTATVTTGVKGYAIKVDQNPTGVPDKNNLVTGTSYTFNNPYSNGTNFYVHVASVDGAGNMSTVTNYLIDNTAPTLTINPNTTAWTNGNVILNVTASDSNSNVKNIKLPDGSYITGSTAQYTVTTNGTYEFESTDNVGNVTKQSITINNIDKTAPTGNVTPNMTNWTNGNVILTAIGADTQSGVKSITKPDGTVISGILATYTSNINGTYDFIITDNVGNTFTKSYTVNNIDKTLPNLKLTLDSDLITNKTVTINATASDGESGIQSITKPDGSVINGSSTSYTVDKNNTYTFKANDVAGNVVTVSITVNNIIAINTISGIDHVEYKLEGATVQNWTTYNSLAIVNEGITTIYARAVDKAGNYSDVATSVVKLDRSVPINTTIKIIAS